LRNQITFRNNPNFNGQGRNDKSSILPLPVMMLPPWRALLEYVGFDIGQHCAPSGLRKRSQASLAQVAARHARA
jgi:hypothetical protein